MMGHDCKKSKFHSILMILCCTLPIAVLGVLYFARTQGTLTGNTLGVAAVLLCPLMHLLMIPLMRKKEGNGKERNSNCH